MADTDTRTYFNPLDFQPLGVYSVTADADYIAPADSSLILWNVESQTTTRSIDFSLIAEGQVVQVMVLQSNGENVVDDFTGGTFFTLSDIIPPHTAVIHAIDPVGGIILFNGTTAQYDIGTSGSTVPLNSNVVHITGAETITGVKTFNANAIFRGSDRVYIGTGQANYFTESVSGLIPGFDYIMSNGVIYRVTSTNDIGTGDLLFQLLPAIGGYGVIQSFNNPLGMVLSTLVQAGTGGPISVRPNGVISADFTTLGTLIATAGTGGTRISKLLTGLATMAGGTIAVADTALTAGSTIQLTPGFAPLGVLSYAKNPGVGFTINSTNPADAGEISYTRCVL